MAVAHTLTNDSQLFTHSGSVVHYRSVRTVPAVVLLIMAIAPWVTAQVSARQVAITTYHYNNYRTGWNLSESKLTPANVSSANFGLLYTVALDERVDAQPLVMPSVSVTAGSFQGVHNVVYVATGNNTVYMIDADNGTVLWSQNLGNPVSTMVGCDGSIARNSGITSTPVIDTVGRTLYVVAYTRDLSGPTYRIHALDLGNLSDKVTPQIVSAFHNLSNGARYSFNAAYQVQRPGLLLANGNVYAGFGSHCDADRTVSRGWLLGWNAASLTPLPANQLLDSQVTPPTNIFLSSIWMSGYGLAADDSGNVLFVTGNSGAGTYDGVTNLQESVVKVPPDLSTVLDLFTPSNQVVLDQEDLDFASGGVMVLPDQSGPIPHLAVAAGKAGTMFLMNESDLGGYSPVMNHVLGSYSVGVCFCGQSYFVDPDGAPRVVSSGGVSLMVWKLTTSPAPTLNIVGSSQILSGQTPGFFTTISSNGASSPVVWALSHANQQNIYLYAFDPDSHPGGVITQLFSGIAGSWPVSHANANLVPVVANGKVYVATYKQLAIFGLMH
ncbi:MAG: PQQ-binding-like beta-propeller repeat protein [Candidatus Korobacteraceae bacterium]